MLPKSFDATLKKNYQNIIQLYYRVLQEYSRSKYCLFSIKKWIAWYKRISSYGTLFYRLPAADIARALKYFETLPNSSKCRGGLHLLSVQPWFPFPQRREIDSESSTFFIIFNAIIYIVKIRNMLLSLKLIIADKNFICSFYFQRNVFSKTKLQS